MRGSFQTLRAGASPLLVEAEFRSRRQSRNQSPRRRRTRKPLRGGNSVCPRFSEPPLALHPIPRKDDGRGDYGGCSSRHLCHPCLSVMVRLITNADAADALITTFIKRNAALPNNARGRKGRPASYRALHISYASQKRALARRLRDMPLG